MSSQARRKILLVKAHYCLSQCLFILRRHNQTIYAILNDLVQTADSCCNHWLAKAKGQLYHCTLGGRDIW